jgi:crotonobetainyl-CoA:carnitine CoA-transferase CaiB-like acyl-CoA transferase
MRCADGWLRTHGNYPHHREALLAALGCESEDQDAARAAAAVREAHELEDAIVAAGGCAALLRDRGTWEAHGQGRALASCGLLELEPGAASAARLAALPDGALPAAGLRVLDLTRVIAGPVAGRTLAALGADVLRIDAPDAIELELHMLDGGPGKRSARLDLRTARGREQFEVLLAQADVLIQGYRPGALDALGFGAAAIGARHPQLVIVSLSAWGAEGPWGGRRGFDSLVQAASGIAVECAADPAGAPGALPAQALDHGTGQLMAAAALRGLAERARTGRALHARFALARTAAWLLDLPRDDAGQPAGDPATAPNRFLIDLPSPLGSVTLVRPPGTLDGRPLAWTRGPEPIGASPPAWL